MDLLNNWFNVVISECRIEKVGLEEEFVVQSRINHWQWLFNCFIDWLGFSDAVVI